MVLYMPTFSEEKRNFHPGYVVIMTQAAVTTIIMKNDIMWGIKLTSTLRQLKDKKEEEKISLRTVNELNSSLGILLTD